MLCYLRKRSVRELNKYTSAEMPVTTSSTVRRAEQSMLDCYFRKPTPSRKDRLYPSPFALLVCPLVCVALRYSSARAAMSSRQKARMSGTTRPQIRWEMI